MRDLAFVGFLLGFLVLGLKRPFLFVLAYAYVDIVAPQRLSYWMLNSVPVSLIVFALAFGGWLIADDKRGIGLSLRQGAMALLLVHCAYTTSVADFPIDAALKWDWVWKALVFALFLPLTLNTRLRIEALALIMVLCASSIIITGGIKTLGSGGGYGVMQLLVSDNSGLYEGSTISTVAICIIPLILWLMRHGSVFPPDWRVRLFGYALIFACLLIPIGTQARTGLICIGVLAVLLLRATRHRMVYLAAAGAMVLVVVPLLPQSFTDRMATIGSYRADQSASTRLAVWGWTWRFAQDNPMGGGFEAYRQNRVRFDKVATSQEGDTTQLERELVEDQGRAYHSAYFEMLGEQGFPGLILWLFIHLGGIWRMELLYRRFRRDPPPGQQWIAPLALALCNGQIIFMVGALFVGIAFQPFVYMLVALQIGLDRYAARLRRLERQRRTGRWSPFARRAAGAAATSGTRSGEGPAV